ncbi:MAG: hypothetical protein WC285_03895 [Candidatus Gracilibacteria bacterium]|jgi:hypothetical protein
MSILKLTAENGTNPNDHPFLNGTSDQLIMEDCGGVHITEPGIVGVANPNSPETKILMPFAMRIKSLNGIPYRPNGSIIVSCPALSKDGNCMLPPEKGGDVMKCARLTHLQIEEALE